MTSTNPQWSEWSTTHVDNSEYRHSTFIDDNQDNSRDYQKRRFTFTCNTCNCCSTASSYILGIILGVLTCGLILAIFISLWLTSTMGTKGSETSFSTTTPTTQNPQLACFDSNNVTSGVWTQATYSYLAAISANLTLTFSFQTNNKNNWYMDDVSVKDPSSVEMLTNSDFESIPLLTGWTTGSAGSCTGQSGISTTQSHSTTHSYYDSCSSVTTSISQSFSAIGGHVYNVTFWYYLDHNLGGGAAPVQFTVNIN